jgi:hypothetical protein
LYNFEGSLFKSFIFASLVFLGVKSSNFLNGSFGPRETFGFLNVSDYF